MIISTRNVDVDGKELKVWGGWHIEQELSCYQVDGLIDRDTSEADSAIELHWNQSEYDQDHPWVKIAPTEGLMYFGSWKGGKHVKKLVGKAAFDRTGKPLPFLLRIRGGKAAFFLGSGGKPLLQGTGLPSGGVGPSFSYKHFPPDKLPRFGRIRVYYLPDNVPLDAPADLPKAGE